MIGRLILANGPVATLDDEGRWECPADPELAAWLDAVYPPFGPGTSVSPADGIPGRRVVIEAAKLLTAKAEFPPLPEAPPGRIY